MSVSKRHVRIHMSACYVSDGVLQCHRILSSLREREMSEADYEYECERAELFGIDKPNREQFFSRRSNDTKPLNSEVSNFETVNSEELAHQGEYMKRTAGGLDELNNTLRGTQKKINRLKSVCGSLINIVNYRTTTSNLEDDITEISLSNDIKCGANQPHLKKKNVEVVMKNDVVPKKYIQSDIKATVDSQIDKLDAMILKAEKAEVSLSSQNKQIKKFLRK